MSLFNSVNRNENAAMYMLNPNICKHCSKVIPYEKRRNSYCGSSCSALALNQFHKKPGVIRDKHGAAKNGTCIVCGKPAYDKYCSNKCQGEYKWRNSIERIKNSDLTVNLGTVKRYLIETRGYACEICGNSEWQGKPIPLVLDHINGIPEDNVLSNLRLLCHNCHALTETYAGKNKGKAKGREHRMERYYNEKSKSIYC